MYDINHNGSGGLNRVYANVGAELFNGFSLGATASVIFGTIKNKRDVTFSQSDILNRRDEYSYTARDLTYDFGFQYLTNVGKKNLIFGATYCPESNLRAWNKGVVYTYDMSTDFEYIRDTIETFSAPQTDSLPPVVCYWFSIRRAGPLVCVRGARL